LAFGRVWVGGLITGDNRVLRRPEIRFTAMVKYTYYRENKQVIGMKLTKSSFKKVAELIANHGAVEKYAANSEECYISFTQQWPREEAVTLKRGMYITSENAGLKVYLAWEFKNRFTEVPLALPSYYTPTDNEVKVIGSLSRDSELCWGYDHICSETGLTRQEAKKAIDNLRLYDVVHFWRGLMTEEGEVAGAGFCLGSVNRAEALLYRYTLSGGKIDV